MLGWALSVSAGVDQGGRAGVWGQGGGGNKVPNEERNIPLGKQMHRVFPAEHMTWK